MVFLKDSIRLREERLRREQSSNGVDPQKEEVKPSEKLTAQEKLKQLFSFKHVKAGVK